MSGTVGPRRTLLLDLFPNAAVAYSLRKLRTAYTGAAIRVRRSSDNAEQDINFVAGGLNTQSLLDFVGYNLLTYSEDISVGGSWPGTNINRTGTPAYSNVETAPDGTLTGDKLIEDGTTGNHTVGRFSLTILSGTAYNISVYLKQGERTKAQVVSAISGSSQTCDVDLTNGNISNNGFTNTPIVTSEANGWYRFSVTITSTTTTANPPISVRLLNASGQNNYPGNGTSGAYVWGFQLSQSSSVLPYGKTLADVARNGFVTTWYDQSGNANNAAQTTALNQPQIVSSGSLLTINSKPCLMISTNSMGFSLGSTISVGASNYNSFVGKKDGAGTMLRVLTSAAADGYKLMNTYDNKYYIYAKSGSYLVSNSADTTTSQILLTGMNVAGTMSIYKNGSVVATTLNSWNYTNSIGNIGGGASGSAYRIQEAVFYNSEQSSNRTGIENNINTYYTIY